MMRAPLALVTVGAFGLIAAIAKPAPDPEAGKALWSNAVDCRNCHGMRGEGGFAPPLAGLKLPPAVFAALVRNPGGVMPAFPQTMVSDAELADVQAWLNGLPAVDRPGVPRFALPAQAPLGQQLLVVKIGCGQCHGATINVPRASAGATGADFAWFRQLVFDHQATMPDLQRALGQTPKTRLQMGVYSPARLAEADLRAIWSWMREAGLRPFITARLAAPTAVPDGTLYRLDVTNRGVPAKGLAAGGVTVIVRLPAGTTAVAATGEGYGGVHHDDRLGGDVAEWRIATLAPRQHRALSLTLDRAGLVRGVVQWTSPTVSTGPIDSVAITSGSPGAAPTTP